MGHVLGSDVSPVELGMAGMAKMAGGFIGAEALAARTLTARRRQITLIFEDQSVVPLGHEPICLNGRIIRQTTSVAYGYRIGAPIAFDPTGARMRT